MTNAASNTLTSSAQDTATAQVLHEVRISAMMKTLQAQRDSAQNALVNTLSEKAVVEHRLQIEEQRSQHLAAALGQKNQETSELRILTLNLQAQVKELNQLLEAKTQPSAASEEEPLPEDFVPVGVYAEPEDPPHIKEQPGMLQRVVNAVTSAAGG